MDSMGGVFTWIDGERLIRFGAGVVDDAEALLASRGFEEFALLTTERAEPLAPELAAGAGAVLHVPAGPVPDGAAAVRSSVRGRGVVAFGGGRVVDVAKAVAGADGLMCAAIPTTLAGSPMTPFHRMPKGSAGGRLVRPSLVVWDPDLHATLPRGQLVATALNALAHAFESLYGPLANPVAELAALRTAELLGRELPREEPDREAVALGALLGGYAVGATGFAVHHAICQTTVRTAGLPHAETNAVVLPHSVAFMAGRARAEVGRFAAALGEPAADDAQVATAGHDGPDAGPAGASVRVARLTAETGVAGLAEIGLDAAAIPDVVSAVMDHPAIGNTPGGSPSEAEVTGILQAAL
jgi:alcohol dehydrogenase class IV